jgi:DNA-binding CsgD family transcriptional regulator/endogenous inhibitor of DNA gyrase (YacG/DUF329 family)
MKNYKNPSWIKEQLVKGVRNHQIAEICGVSVFTISKYVSSTLDNMSPEELSDLIYQCVNPKQLISSKTTAYQKIVDRTSFLPSAAPIRERCWFILNGTTDPPKCKMCTSPVNWDHTSQTFRTYCSHVCQGQDFDSQRKRQQTTLEKYGVAHPASCEEINQKRKATLLSRYGVEHQNQRHFSDETIKILNDREYLEKLIQEKSTFEIADDLQISQSGVSKYLRKHNIVSPKRSASQYERELINFIETLTDKEVVANSRQVIPPQELDIFIPELNLAIEFNGLYWHSELSGKNKFYHVNKTQMCHKKGIRLIHIYEHLWKANPTLVKSRLKNLFLSNENTFFARKCHVVSNIPTQQAREFFRINHIQGFAPASIYLGLSYGNSIVSMMSFGKARYSSKYEYELIRFCSQQNCNVVGGASKMFKYFVNTFSPSSIITYSDKTWNTGNVYAKMGFTYSHTSDPNYHYFAKGENTVVSRIKFQKHKLKAILEHFDPLKTEWENMIENEYDRIWDCGNDVFVWNDGQGQ